MRPRSYLYVPGTYPRRFRRALESGADAVILDLEDSVPVEGKEEARAAVRDFLDRTDPGGVEVWVRINAGTSGADDLRAVLDRPALTGLCPAKTDLDDLVALDRELAGIASPLALEPLVEDARAVLAAGELACLPRVRRLQVGEVDLQADLGLAPGPDERELLWPRSAIVLGCAARGAEAPVGGPSREFHDLAAFRASTEHLWRLGFAGRACIHPAQVPVVNDVFTPSTDDLAWARGVVRRLEAAALAGHGVAVDEDGRLLDEAVVRGARRILDRVPSG